VARYLSGTCASGVHEAKLGREYFGGEVHTYSAAYSEADLKQVLELSDHVVFNTPFQWNRFRKLCIEKAKSKRLKFGLRVNPEHSEGHTALYDPAAPFSRLGTPRAGIKPRDLDGLSGLHFHTLCEHDFPPLERTLAAVLTPEIPTQDVAFVLIRLLGNPFARVAAWRFIQKRWSAIRRRVPPLMLSRLVDATPALREPRHAREVQSFFRRHPLPEAERALKQALEVFRLNDELRRREAKGVGRWLAGK